jgi:hypothetical protein
VSCCGPGREEEQDPGIHEPVNRVALAAIEDDECSVSQVTVPPLVSIETPARCHFDDCTLAHAMIGEGFAL